MRRQILVLACVAAFAAACGSDTGNTRDDDDTADVVEDSGDAGGDTDPTDTGLDTPPDEDVPPTDTGSDAADVPPTDTGTDADPDVADADEDTEDTGPRTCMENRDCLGGEVCADGFCVGICTVDADCSAPTPACETGSGICVECNLNGQCADDEACVDNACTFFCQEDAQCAGGEFCDEIAGECLEIECVEPRDCQGGQTCVNAVCVEVDDIICDAGVGTCEGNTAVQCSVDGTEETSDECGNDLCVDDDGVARCAEVVCTANDRGCLDDTTAFVCDSTGTEQETTACEGDAFCESGMCIDPTCTPDTSECRGDFWVECDARGVETQTLCSGGCVDGVGCPDPCDRVDGPRGCEFWAAPLDNLTGMAPSFTPVVAVVNGDEGPADVELLDAAGSVVASVSLGLGESATLELDSPLIDNSINGADAFRVMSDVPVTAFQLNPVETMDTFTNDGSLLLPQNQLGTEYVAVAWGTEGDDMTRIRGNLTVIATEDGTTVTIVPTGTVEAGDAVDEIDPGVETEFTLDAGTVLNLAAEIGSDLSGTLITATAPVAVFGGAECGNVPEGVGFCDHLEEQLAPTSALGTEFVALKSPPRGDEPDVWRVVATQDGTTLTTTPALMGIDGVTVDAGDFVEVELVESFVLNASAPVALAQYLVGSSYPGPDGGCDAQNMVETGCAIPRTCGGDPLFGEPNTGIGDPSMTLIHPPETPPGPIHFFVPAGYEQSYLSVAVPTGESASVDGAMLAGPTTVGGYTFYRVEVTEGEHTLDASDDLSATVFLYACDVSMAYPVTFGTR